jgi:D-alanyl-lipoteichoic acid acyltransferase DltB (MBOAT superfamily)
MISFAMDYNWALNPSLNIKKHCKTKKDERTQLSLPVCEYNLKNYCAFILYAPLFLSGPIISFNDFQHQKNDSNTDITFKSILKYAVRLAFSIIVMEIYIHINYHVAIKDTKAWVGFSPFEIFIVGVGNLLHIWLKVFIK